MSPVGKTKDAGWEIGVSRTVNHPVARVWDFLTSPAGTALWLGHGVNRLDEKGAPYETDEGTVGEVRSFRPLDRLRLTWQPTGWRHETTVQIVVRETGPGKTSVRFHQERLANAEERERQRAHWKAVAASIAEALDRLP